MADSVIKEFLLKFKADDSGLKKGKESVNALEKGLKSLAKGLIKNVIGWGGLVSAIIKFAKQVKDAIKWTIEMNKSLEKEAKALNKSTEAARAHLVALKVMGKTMEEINKDESLKKVYDDLVKLGESMALPQAAKGLSTLNDVINAWTKIKYAAYYALQWIWYYMQKYMKTPLENVKKFLNGSAENFSKTVQAWAKKAAYYISIVINGIRSLIKTVKSILSSIKSLWTNLSGQGKSTMLMVVGILMLIFNKGLALKLLFGGLLLLLDDFFAMMRGDKTALSTSTWEKLITIFYRIRNGIAKIINGVLDAINYVVKWFGGEAPFEYGLHIYSDEEIQGIVTGLTANAREGDKQREVQSVAISAAEWLERYDDSTATEQQREGKAVVEEWLNNYYAARAALNAGDETMAAAGDAVTNVDEDNSTTNVNVNNQFYITDVESAKTVADIIAANEFGVVESALASANS